MAQAGRARRTCVEYSDEHVAVCRLSFVLYAPRGDRQRVGGVKAPCEGRRDTDSRLSLVDDRYVTWHVWYDCTEQSSTHRCTNEQKTTISHRQTLTIISFITRAVSKKSRLGGVMLQFSFIGSRPSDHYFRSVCWFVCLSVCFFVCAEFFSAVFDPISIKLGHMLYVSV